MTVKSVDKDFETLSMVVVAEFDAPPERVWDLWADPRKLERWWGPPTHPATVKEHDLGVGGEVTYYMTAPDGQKFHGWWRVNEVDEPNSIVFNDGFADSDGNPAEGMPVSATTVTFTADGDGTRMEMHTTYETREQLQEILDMGALEGIKQAITQMDALLTNKQDSSTRGNE